MAQAKRTADIPGWTAAKTEEADKNKRGKSLRNKTFEELTAGDKDLLLKVLFVQAKLIRNSPDE